MKSLKNRKGFIKIDQNLLKNLSIRDAKALFSCFYPISINSNHLFMDDRLTYYGYSERFEEVKDGFPGNEYEIIITRLENGESSVEFKRVEE